MKLKKLKEFFIQLWLLALIIFGIVVVYYYSWVTGGKLTTAESCSELYIRGDIEIHYLKRECSSLSKESLVKAIDSSTNITPQEKLNLLQDIEDNF